MKTRQSPVKTPAKERKIDHSETASKKIGAKLALKLLSCSLIWSILTVICLAINISLLVDLAYRFLSGEPGTLSVLAVILQSLVTLISGGALSAHGRRVMRRVFSAVAIKRRFWNVSEFGLSLLAFAFLLYFRLSLGGISVLYNNHGSRQYVSGKLRSAEKSFKMAIRLNPDLASAYGNLGSIYDDQQDYEEAKKYYILSSQAGNILAYSKLARLHIVSDEVRDYEQAVYLLSQALDLEKSRDVSDGTKYSLRKSMGWVRFHQGHYEVAERYLIEAIKVIPENASAHCIYAQTLEHTGRVRKSLQYWRNCLDRASSCKRDQDRWIRLARHRLKVQSLDIQDCTARKIYRSGDE